MIFGRKKDRRKEARVKPDQRVSVTLRTNTRSEAMRGKVLDRSPSGCAIAVPEFVMREMPIEVQLQDGSTISGQVEYCQPLETGLYRLGMRVLS